MYCRLPCYEEVTFQLHSFPAQFPALTHGDPLTWNTTSHTHTLTHWLSLLLTLTLSICLPMTVGLSSTLWCSLSLCEYVFQTGVCVWRVCVSVRLCQLVQMLTWGPGVLYISVFLQGFEHTHCLHVPFVRVHVWVGGFMFFQHFHLQCSCVSECDGEINKLLMTD